MFVNNSETCLENYETSERKAGVERNGGLCKKPVDISLVHLNRKSTLTFPPKKPTIFYSQKQFQKLEEHLTFERVATIPCLFFVKCLKPNMNKIKISFLTVSKFKHEILLLVCNCSKKS